MTTEKISKNITGLTVLVTGGAGFIGSNLVESLLKLPLEKVIVFDDLSTGFMSNIEEFKSNSKFSFIQDSITDFEACKKAFENVDIVYHLAALGSVPRSINNPVATNNVNAGGFVNVLTAAKDAGVKRIVYSSSSSVYGNDQTLPKIESKIGKALSPYAVSKRTNELYADVFSDLYDIDVVGLRYFNVFGPKQSLTGPYSAVIPIFVSNLLKGDSCFINGDGKISRDFTFVQNVVHANLLASLSTFEKGAKRLFNVAMGDQISLTDLYEAIESQIHSGLEVAYNPPRVGDISSSLASIELAKDQLGYKPQLRFEEGLKITIDWYRSNT
ncbi:MAG: UDP-N-acetylglucosamine 4-epimerase [Arenicella sp.]|jgi:UDP-N-acetylglucosamine 4-epimerase